MMEKNKLKLQPILRLSLPEIISLEPPPPPPSLLLPSRSEFG